MKKQLPRLTLIAADTYKYGEAISAIKKSLHQIEPAKAKFLTDIQAYNPNLPFEIVPIKKLDGKSGYSNFIIKELDKHFDTDFVLLVQHDGYVLDGNAWDDEFLEYDYIGAPWLESDGYNVGNGGFSLRSKKLQHILATDDFIKPVHSAEDVIICRIYRPYLEEKYSIKFAPEGVADRFSFELRQPVQPTFGFHGKFHEPYRPSVVVKRSGALGDIIATEPLLEYYHKRGYEVYIDMPVHLCMYFGTHWFPVKHISQMDGRVNPLVINLDGAYEEKPQQLHLKSYYEKAGISDGEVKNPSLRFPINEFNKLFERYCVLHIDNRDQPYRNIYGVDFGSVVRHLNEMGYLVIQVGQYEHEKINGAIQMKTQTTNLLHYLVAGSDLFVGIDSGVSNMAVACDKRCVIFAGSVNPEFIYPDLSKCEIVTNQPCCDKPYCWHDKPGTIGQDCYIDKEQPPCTQYRNSQVLEAINKVIAK